MTPSMLTSIPFAQAIGDWERAAAACLAARVKYEDTYGKAILAADAKDAATRKSQADLASLKEWEAWKAADIAATVAWQIVLFMTPAAPAARPVLA